MKSWTMRTIARQRSARSVGERKREQGEREEKREREQRQQRQTFRVRYLSHVVALSLIKHAIVHDAPSPVV